MTDIYKANPKYLKEIPLIFTVMQEYIYVYTQKDSIYG